MTQVVIQPSYGNADARQHWKDTLDQEVNYQANPFTAILTLAERKALDALHPNGTARFWGATGNHDKRMATLTTGDVILFTGKNLVRAVGEVGHSFRNPAFADLLWDPHPDRGSYCNVYSLRNFQPTAIPYQEIWDLPGFNTGDNFMGLRFLDEDKGHSVIEGLGIQTLTSEIEAAAQEQEITASLTPATVIDVEAVNTTHTSYERTAGTTLVHRTEALLVKEYRATLTTGTVKRIKVASGITDLYVIDDAGAEIVEAKKSADHGFVRQALGQLLDYAPHSPHQLARLTALFPVRPADADLTLLHRYGIDCVYREEQVFQRLEAPDERRQHMMLTWANI